MIWKIKAFSTLPIAIIALLTAPTAAADPNWDALSQCESSGNWSIATGSFEGGLQFANSTWLGHGGGAYAPHAYQATREQQIDIARRVLQSQGPGAWPTCWPRTQR